MIRTAVALALALLIPHAARAQDPEAPLPDPEAGDVPVESEAKPEPGSAPKSAAADWSLAQSVDTERQAEASEGSDEQADEADDGEELDTRYPNKKFIDAVLEKSQKQSLGYAVGGHGEGVALGIRYDIPVNDFFFMRLGPYMNFGPIVRKPFDPVAEFRIETMFRGDVLFGLFRLYGGGGMWVGFRPNPHCSNPLDQADVDEATARAVANRINNNQVTPQAPLEDPNVQKEIGDGVKKQLDQVKKRCDEQKDAFGITGGGYAGIEFFESPTRAFFIEIGGQGGIQKLRDWHDGGLIVQTGSQFYF